MRPTPSDVHVDAALTDVSVAFLQAQSNFVFPRVFPRVQVSKQSDKYFVFDRGSFNRDEAQVRGPGTEAALADYSLTTAQYFADVLALKQRVPYQTVANADAAIDPEAAAAEVLMNKMLIKQERDFASTFMAPLVWGTDVTGDSSGSVGLGETTYWSDYTNSDPIQDVEEGIDTILGATGLKPNKLVLGREVYSQLRNHPDVIDRIKASGGVGPNSPAVIMLAAMAQIFDLDEVLVSNAVYNSATEGATESSSFIVGKNALLVHSPDAPGLMVPAAGYTFSWSQYTGVTNPMGVATSRYDRPELKSVEVEAEMAYDMKLVSADLGYFFSGIVA